MKNNILTSRPICIESLVAKSRSKEEMEIQIHFLVSEINKIIGPEKSISIINEVNYITPCNIDRSKFYFQVNGAIN